MTDWRDPSALYCPDCRSRVISGGEVLTGFPETPTVDIEWYCPCCEYEMIDPEWTPMWWSFDSYIPHVVYRIKNIWRILQEDCKS